MSERANGGIERLWIALGDRYAVERELGHGGMAVVYLARDLKHDRLVAVKVLRPELATSLAADRFLREIKIAGGMQHPHVLGLLDSGEADGDLYYVMPYVVGESVRRRLDRETQLPVETAIQLATEVADALGYADGLGIVHRDIKPENILISGGHAMVADFGIATALSAAGGERITQTGIAVGTAAYMSPEQASGAQSLDGRSDVYALGCVLYEMLAGSPPFTGPTAQAILARHSVDPVPSLRSVRGAVHPGIEWAITKAMAKVPADRFATAADFRAALAHPEKAPLARPQTRRRAVTLVSIALGFGALISLNIGGLRDRLLGRPLGGSIRSIAVLPIENLTGDTTLVYMADGMTDQFFTDLAQIKALRVVGRQSVMRSRDSTKSIQQIATALGVDAVVTGSLQRSGDSIHVSTQLISAGNGVAIWTKSGDGAVRDILRLQSELARSMARDIRVELTADESTRLSGAKRTIDPAAYALYVKGRYYWNKRAAGDLQRARTFFTQALDVDPTYADAWAGLADTYNALGYGGILSPRESFPKAKAAAVKALDLDSTNAAAHASLGYAVMYYDWDWAAAEREYRKAIELNPNWATAHDYYSLFLLAMGRFDSAEVEGKRAMDLDPLSVPAAYEYGWVAHYSGRQDEAVTRLQAAVAMGTADPNAHLRLGRAYQAKGRYEDAMKEYEQAGRGSVNISSRGYVHAILGNRKAALERLAELDSVGKAGTQYVAPLVRALVYHALGDDDRALALLNESVSDRVHWLVWMNRDPRWTALRSDPRFQAISKRVGLPL